MIYKIFQLIIMKRIFLNLFFLFPVSLSIAQTCKISGTTNDASIKEVQLFLLDGGYFEAPTAKLAVLPNGCAGRTSQQPRKIIRPA
jgi:hypothetical protein